MAQKGVQLDTESISCSICLEVLKDPVTIPCGHSYCMSCIKAHFDGEDQKGVHSCPQCREKFIPRPVLVKNTMFADLVEQLKKTGLQAAPADHCYAGPEDVACDFCSGRKLRASKSCLSCVASYCEEHLQPHYDVAPLKKHKLVEPSKKLQENICSVHDEVKKLFCRTDQKSICYLCSVDEHKGHHTVSAAAERTERQRELEGRRQQIQQRIQNTQKDVKLLQQEVEAIDQSADKTVEDSEKMFSELIRLIQNRRSDVEQQVRSQQQTAVRGVKELQQELQQEITELQRKDAELQQLSHTEDHVQFLTSCPSLPALGESTHSSSIRERPLNCFEDVTAAVSELTDKLQHILTQDWTKVSLAAAQPDVLLPPEPESTADFLRCSRKITLDPNTAHIKLLLSKGNRKVKLMNKPQSYPDHPDRFTDWSQVLSRESLTGRCYWEVECRGGMYGFVGISVAVAYKNISRKGSGNECRFGYNDKSWALYCDGNSSTFRFNSIVTSLSAPPPSRVGVYLDPRAGILSFYSVSETMTLLHRVQTTFTQPLYAGVGITQLFSSAEFYFGMAQKGVQLDTESISCSICLDVLKDPVTIPCGHSYCMSCIKAHFDGEDQKGLHSCPQCRERFIPRPVLVRNTMLADLVEQLKKTGLQAAPADHCYAGPEDVACDFCSGRKLRASKSCLSCVASYCEEHLQPHYDVAPLKKHKLVKPSKKLQENICSVHDEVKKLFCRTDQKSICYICSVEEHKGHHTVSAAAERTERQRELEGRRQQIQQRIQDTQKDVKLLQQEVEAIDQSADKTVEDSEKTFAELIRLIQNRRSDVEQQVRSQQQTAVRGVKELQQELQQEITELQRKDAELQQLSHTEDHVQFLTSCPSLPALGESTHSSSIRERPLSCFEDVTAAVSELTDKLQHILTQDWTKVSLAAAQPDVLLPPEPKSRADFLRCSRRITLDPNTAHRVLLLSEGNRKVRLMNKPQSYPDHPDRFTDRWQVLSRESLTGRCYWEVEWRGGGVYVAVAYKNISRKGYGNESGFGYNDKSWALYCGGNSPTFRFNSIETSLSAPPPSRVGVYLDPRAGILSFYSVSETRTLLHRVQTTFTQPLYAGLWVYSGSSAELCELR
ncbi:uncharacterized protein ACNS7B_017301 [Menidia menidia]